MPPIFSESDRNKIRESLIETGFSMMKEQGIKGMNVDLIVAKVGIAKGTFYHFFSSKQDFIIEIIRSFQKKKIDEFMKKIEESGELELEELFTWYKEIIQSPANPLLFLNPKDAEWLRENLPAEVIYNKENEIVIAKGLLSKIKGIRKDIDYEVVANFPKVIFLAIEHKEELHENVLEKNIEMMLDTLKRYLLN